MLNEPAARPLGEKRIGLIARNPALEALLRGLLMQWDYTLLDTPAAAEMLLVEEGCLAPAANRNVLWLTSSRYEGRNRLGLPLLPEELWRQLESHYHKPPRNHIRIALQLPATLRVRGENTCIQITNLSDLGGRFEFPRELVKAEQVTLQAELVGESLNLTGRVIYVVPKGDLEGTGRSEIGVIFEQTPQETRLRVREYILWRYLELARPQIPEELFCQGLEFFQLPQAVLKRLVQPV